MNEHMLVGPGVNHIEKMSVVTLQSLQLALSAYPWYACPRCHEICVGEPTKRAGSFRLVNATGYLHLQECVAYTPKDQPVRYRQAPRQVVAS